jgi:hypothetical protein
MEKVDKIIEGDKIFIRLNNIKEIIKENKLIISDNLLYKSAIGKGGLYPFYFIDKEESKKYIFLFIENTKCWINTKYKTITLYLKKRDENYLKELIMYLMGIGKLIGIHNVTYPIKKTKKNTLSINIKYYENNGKLSTTIIDLEHNTKINSFDGYTLCEGSFIIRVTGIFKGNLSENVIFHLNEAVIKRKPVYVESDDIKLNKITKQRLRKNITEKEMRRIKQRINKKGDYIHDNIENKNDDNFNLPL